MLKEILEQMFKDIRRSGMNIIFWENAKDLHITQTGISGADYDAHHYVIGAFAYNNYQHDSYYFQKHNFKAESLDDVIYFIEKQGYDRIITEVNGEELVVDM